MSILPILINKNLSVEVKGFNGELPDIMSSTGTKIVNVSTDIVKTGIANIVNSMSDLLDNVNFNNEKYEVEELKVNLNVGAKGEVSIMALTGDANVTSSITITIKKRNDI